MSGLHRLFVALAALLIAVSTAAAAADLPAPWVELVANGELSVRAVVAPGSTCPSISADGVTLVVNRQDIETAQEEIDDHIGPNGPIVAALQDVTIDDTLGHLTRNVTVNSAMRYGAYKIGGTDYFGVQLSVCVLA